MRRFGSLLASWLLFMLFFPSHLGAQTLPHRLQLDPDEPGEEEELNRTLWEWIKKTPYTEALHHIAQFQGMAPDAAQVSLPNGWRLTPAGAQVEVGRLPYEAIPFAGRILVLNTGYYTGSEQPEVSVIDPGSGQILQTLRFDALFPSACEGQDHDLYLSGGISQKVYRLNSQFEIVGTYPTAGYAGALAPLDATHIAVASLVTSSTPADFPKGKYGRGQITILNTRTGASERTLPTGFFPYALCFAQGKLYAAVLGEDKLQVYDTHYQLVKTILVGRSPQAITRDGDRLYVVNANSDSLSVIDTNRDEVVAAYSLSDNRTRFGGAPTSCAIDGDRLYVSLADINAVAVLDKHSGKRLGLIPTGWYPTKILVQDDRLFTLSAKGIRPRRPNPHGPQPTNDSRNGPDYVLTLLHGALGVIPKTEIGTNLKRWTQQVKAGAPLFSPRKGFKPPVRHIFYIIRENRTYDQVLGDLPAANGDNFLTLFGREITPNGHQIAEDYVTLDNYFADGEISVLGHSFTTSGYASPFLEWIGNAYYSGRYNAYLFGTVPAATSPAYLWDALDQKHVDYRIYGENYYLYTRGYAIVKEAFGADSEMAQKFYAQMMTLASQVDRGNTFYRFAHAFAGQNDTPQAAWSLLGKEAFVQPLSQFLVGDSSLAAALAQSPTLKRRFAAYLSRYPLDYRSWDLLTSDLERVRAWKSDFERQLQHGRVPGLEYIWLPNDHTNGARLLPLPPEQFVAQNDAALGRIIETITHSPVWKESLILITEDDAQAGPDHVDATRTVALAVGPYVKRKAVISDRFDQLSLLRTIELLLGLAPLNRNDALAVPMWSLFTDQPDFQPYLPPQPSSHLSDEDRNRYQQLGSK